MPNVEPQTFPQAAPEPARAETAIAPRLPPIDRYAGFWLALLRAGFRFTFGKIMLPLRVIFPRIPGYAFAHFWLLMFAQRSISLPKPLVHVLSMRISRNNSCSFCFDMHKAAFMLEKPDLSMLAWASRDATDPELDPEVQAILSYADEVVMGGDVSDATFAALRARFNERQVVEVVWIAAFVIYLTMLARPLRIPSEGFCTLVEAKRR